MLISCLCLYLFAWCCLNAQFIQIGSGTVINRGLPFEPSQHFSYSQQIYLNSEINSAGLITALSFNYRIVSSTFLTNNGTLNVRIGQTPLASFTDWIEASSLTPVFSGDFIASYFNNGIPGEGWMTLPLQTPYFYDGNANLVIAVDENLPGFSSVGDDFYCSPTAQARGIVFNSLTVNPDPDNPPTTGYHLRNHFANLRLHINPINYTPFNPLPPHNATALSIDTALAWQSDATFFDISLGTDPAALTIVASGIGQCQWQPPSPLTPFTAYHWQVTAHHNDQTYSSPIWTFQTAGEIMTAPRHLNGWFVANRVNLTWQAPTTGTVVEYQIFRNTQPLDRTVNLQYEDYAIHSSATYYYYVKAVNHLNQMSPPSNTVSVTVPVIMQNVILYQGFETSPTFTQSIADWLNLDLDNSPTWEWDSTTFPMEGTPLGWLIFTPAETVPPISGVAAYSGQKYAISMAALNPPNNDLLISPLINLGYDPLLSFHARSFTADYGLERLKVLISATGTEPQDFITIHPAPYLSVPAAWTEYQYDLTPWQGQSVRIAFQCVSWDALALLLDDIWICGVGGYVSINDHLLPPPQYLIHPNPTRDSFQVTAKDGSLFSGRIYDLRGRLIHRWEPSSTFDSALSGSDLKAGLYLIRLSEGRRSVTRKVTIIR